MSISNVSSSVTRGNEKLPEAQTRAALGSDEEKTSILTAATALTTICLGTASPAQVLSRWGYAGFPLGAQPPQPANNPVASSSQVQASPAPIASISGVRSNDFSYTTLFFNKIYPENQFVCYFGRGNCGPTKVGIVNVSANNWAQVTIRSAEARETVNSGISDARVLLSKVKPLYEVGNLVLIHQGGLVWTLAKIKEKKPALLAQWVGDQNGETFPFSSAGEGSLYRLIPITRATLWKEFKTTNSFYRISPNSATLVASYTLRKPKLLQAASPAQDVVED